jgi:hypothetical protein
VVLAKISLTSTTPSAPVKVAARYFLDVANTPPRLRRGILARILFGCPVRSTDSRRTGLLRSRRLERNPGPKGEAGAKNKKANDDSPRHKHVRHFFVVRRQIIAKFELKLIHRPQYRRGVGPTISVGEPEAKKKRNAGGDFGGELARSAARSLGDRFPFSSKTLGRSLKVPPAP